MEAPIGPAGTPALVTGGSSAGGMGWLAAAPTGTGAGTAYPGAPEPEVQRPYRARLPRSSGKDTVLTGLFDVGWPEAPHRVLRNATLDAWEAAGRPSTGRRPGEHDEI